MSDQTIGHGANIKQLHDICGEMPPTTLILSIQGSMDHRPAASIADSIAKSGGSVILRAVKPETVECDFLVDIDPSDMSFISAAADAEVSDELLLMPAAETGFRVSGEILKQHFLRITD